MTYKKSYGKETKENERQEHLSREQQNHRKAYTSKSCDICGYTAFQPYKDKLLCYECYEKAWGAEGCEPYDREKAKVVLDKVKDPFTRKWLVGIAKNMRLKAQEGGK